jgi:hypothetical protein
MRDKKYYNKNLRCVLFILFVVLFHGFCNYRIISASRFSFAHDQSLYYTESVKFFYGLQESSNGKQLWALYTSVGNHYRPPLFIMISGLFYFFLGISQNAAIMSNLFYLAILLCATCGIGKKMYNVRTGVAAGFLLSMFPVIFGYSRVFFADLALASMVALSLCLFVFSEEYANVKYSLLFGLSMGLGLLTKQSYIIYVFPLLAYSLIKVVSLKNPIRLRNFLLAIVLGLGLAASWYLPHWSTIAYKFPRFAGVVFKEYTHWYSYIELFYNYQLLLPFFALFLGALVFLVIRKDYFLPFIAVTQLFILSLFPNKFPRFTVPVFVCVAVMIARLICFSEGRKYKIVSRSVYFFSLAQFFLICFIPNEIFYLRPLLTWEHPSNDIGIYHVVDKGYWQTEEIWRTIAGDVGDITQHKTVLVVPNISHLHGPLQIRSAIMRAQLYFYCPAEHDLTVPVPADYGGLVLSADYVMIKSGRQGYSWREKYIEHLEDAFNAHKDEFIMMKEFPLPDNSSVSIYKRRLGRAG